MLVRRWTRLRRTQNDLLKTILLLCFLALTSHTIHTLPRLQNVLDKACCGLDFPLLLHSTRRTRLNPPLLPPPPPPIIGKPKSKSNTSTCLIHEPLLLENYTMNVRKDAPKSSATTRRVNPTEPQWLHQPSAPVCGTLRRSFWRHGYAVQSKLAIEIERHQTQCELPVATFPVDNDYGMGSHLYVWSQALCNAQQDGYRIATYNPRWLWLDQTYCASDQAQMSPFLCYFPNMEYRCGIETIPLSDRHNITNAKDTKQRCQRMMMEEDHDGFLEEFRAAAMEYIFQNISSLVVQEAERQVGLLFGEMGAPDDLITVHIRWGDKFWEMDLVPISEYVDAVSQMLHTLGRDDNSTANIYLASEDPKAILEFREKAPPGWNIYADRTVTELNPYRPARGNRASWTTRNTRGRAGLVALGSLLVAMEADNFVITTGSNWSRLINQLRKNVLDAHCGNCTRVIDLRSGEW